MQEKDKERRQNQPERKYHGIKGKKVPGQESWHWPLPEGYKEGSTKGKKSTVGGGEQGVRTETPEHMKPPKKKSKSSTKKTRKGSPTSFTEKAGVAQDIGPWKPTDRKATKPKVSYEKRKKTPFGMKKGGSVDAQWGGYNFKDGGRIPGIRPTRKGT